MDTLLIAVTALSLLMAAAMAAVVMKMLRDERRRSDARVVALAEMAAEPATADVGLKPDPTPDRATPVREPELARARTIEATPRVSHAPARGFADLPIRAEAVEDTTDVRSLFDEPQRSSPWGGRLAIIAALVLVIGGGGWLLLHGPSRAGGEQAQTAVAERAPLELLSLRYSQEGDRLTITGLVQNPRTGAPLTRVVATAFAFGPDGAFLASGRAPIDFTSLGAGDESPFVVAIPVSGTVARYRVGFRAEDGTVIAHVDKRQDALAQR